MPGPAQCLGQGDPVVHRAFFGAVMDCFPHLGSLRRRVPRLRQGAHATVPVCAKRDGESIHVLAVCGSSVVNNGALTAVHDNRPSSQDQAVCIEGDCLSIILDLSEGWVEFSKGAHVLRRIATSAPSGAALDAGEWYQACLLFGMRTFLSL